MLEGKGVILAGEIKIEQAEFSMSLQPLTSFEKQKYYQNKPKFNGVYSNNNLLKRRNEAYVTNFDGHRSIGFHWIALYVNDDNFTV